MSMVDGNTSLKQCKTDLCFLIFGFSGPWSDGPMDGFEGGPPPYGPSGGPSPFGGNDQGGFGDFDE